jgi:hypothetical protein
MSTRKAQLFARLAETYRELAELEGGPANEGPANESRAGYPRKVGIPPAMLSKAELGAALHRSAATIDRWVLDGMPCESMGTYRLFSLAACQAWAASRPKPGRPAKKAPLSPTIDADTAPEYTIRTRARKTA